MGRIFKDQMTPMERAAALANCKDVDRLPCNPNVANGVSRVYGCKVSDFNRSARTLADAQIASYRRFGYDSVRIFTDLFPWAEAMGATLTLPEDSTADLLEPALKTKEDILNYQKIPVINPYKDGRLPIYLEAMKYLVDEIGSEVGCTAALVGPFTNACFLVGVEKILRMCLREPEVVHHLCQISLESLIAYADAAIDIGLGPTISEPMSSCTVISPAIFKTFSEPYLKQLVHHIQKRGKGVVMHICGKTAPIWNDIADMGIAGFSIDNVASILDCKHTIGHKTKILGNVDPATTMYMGTPNAVKLETLQCIKDGYDSPKGFVPMSGCSLPIETPFANIDAMLDTVAELGYPVDPQKLDSMIEDAKQLCAKE